MRPVRSSARAALVILALAASVAVLVSLGPWLPSGGAVPASGVATDAPAVLKAWPEAAAAAREALAATTGIATTIAEPAAAPPPGSLRGSVHVRARWQGAAAPAAGIDLNLAPRDPPTSLLDEHSAVSDAAGEATFEGLRPGRYRIYRSSSTAAEVEVTAGVTVEVELVLERGFAVDGRVVDAAGTPVPGAQIWLARSHVGVGFDDGRVVTVSDARGEFQLQHIDKLRLVAALASGRAPSRRYEVSGADGALVPVTIVAGPRGGTIRGQVRDHRGEGLAGRVVRLGPQGGYGQVRFESGFASVGPAQVEVRTSPEGRFEARRVHPGDVLVTVARPGSEWAPWSQALHLVDGAEIEVEISLALGWSVEGTVRGTDARSLADAVVWVPGQDRQPSIAQASSDAEGRFEIRGLPAGPVTFQAMAIDIGEAEATLEGQPGQVLRWDPVLGTGLALRGRVLDEGDAPLAHCRVEAARLDAPWEQTRASTGDDGRFVFANLPDVAHRLSVSPKPDGPVRLVVEPARPGGGEVTLRVPAASEPTAFVRGRVLGTDGRGASASHVELACEALHWGSGAEVDPETGVFQLGPLPPGEYRGRIWSTLHANHVLGQIVLVAREDRDLGVIRVARGGDLVVSLSPPELLHAPASGKRLNVTVLDADGQELVPCFREADQARPMSPLPAGRYALSVLGTDLRPQVLPFTLSEGAETRIEVRLARAASCRFALALAPDVPRDQWIDLSVADASGVVVLRVRFYAMTVDHWQVPFTAGLPEGRLTATVVAESGQRAVLEFEMGDRDREIALVVR